MFTSPIWNTVILKSTSSNPPSLVGGGSAVGAPDGGDDTEDMDDLEAEIARELEGLEDD